MPYNALMICSLSGHAESVEGILERKIQSGYGHTIDTENPAGETAFSLTMEEIADSSVVREKKEMSALWSVAQKLLSSGADLFPENQSEKQSEKFRQIIATESNRKDGGTLLMLFSRMGRLDIVEKLLAIPEVKDSINERYWIPRSFFFESSSLVSRFCCFSERKQERPT